MLNRRVKIIRTTKKGVGVIALQDFKAGETVIVAKMIQTVPERNNFSIQTDWDKHIIIDEPAIFLNHSCAPNLGIQDNAYGAFDFIALQDIQKGEELTWDYCMSEYISISVKECLCASPNCRKIIKGYRDLPNHLKQQYKDYIAGYLKK